MLLTSGSSTLASKSPASKWEGQICATQSPSTLTPVWTGLEKSLRYVYESSRTRSIATARRIRYQSYDINQVIVNERHFYFSPGDTTEKYTNLYVYSEQYECRGQFDLKLCIAAFVHRFRISMFCVWTAMSSEFTNSLSWITTSCTCPYSGSRWYDAKPSEMIWLPGSIKHWISDRSTAWLRSRTWRTRGWCHARICRTGWPCLSSYGSP